MEVYIVCFYLYEVEEQIKLNYVDRNKNYGCLFGCKLIEKGYERNFWGEVNVVFIVQNVGFRRVRFC